MLKNFYIVFLLFILAAAGLQAQQTIVLTVQGEVHFKSTGAAAADVFVEAFVPSPISSIKFSGNGKTDDKGFFTFQMKAPEGTLEIQVATKTNCSDPTGAGLEIQAAKVSPDGKTFSQFWICDSPTPTNCFAKAWFASGSGKTIDFFGEAYGAAANEKFEYLWHFGDGSTSNAQNPSHEYAAAGQYKVQFIAKTASCYAVFDLLAEVVDLSNSQQVKVWGQIKCASDGSPVVKQYVWIANSTAAGGGIGTFTDAAGFYSAAVTLPKTATQVAVQTFTPSGVVLTEITKIANSAAEASFKMDCAAPPPPPKCEVKFLAKDLGNNSFQFFADNFPTVAGAKIFYFWDFGDGTGSTDASPTHTFLKDGVYTVWLKTLDDSGCVATASLPIKAFANGGGGDPATDCQAMFYAEAQLDPAGVPTTTFIFKDASIGKTVKWQWFFGDGTTSNEQHPTHTFAKNGSYTVTLKTTADNGCESKIAFEIWAGDKLGNEWDCQAMFLPLPDASKLGFQFLDLSVSKTSPVAAWRWDFGDGSSSAEQNPFHVFAKAGIYKVSLEIKGDQCNSIFSIALDTEKQFAAGSDEKIATLGLSAQSSGADEAQVLFEKLSVFPNPTSGDLKILLENASAGEVEISILDLSGKVLRQRNLSLAAGKSVFEEDVAGFSDGLYFLRFRTAGGLQVIKFFKK